MKKWIKAVAVVGLSAALASPAFAGNGAPSGAHFNLNIIGVPKAKTADMTNDDGHRIFVSLGSSGTTATSKIMLTESDAFQVLDANGTDGTAKFALPNPDPNNTGVTEYSVYARALGKPGGQAKMTTCFTPQDDAGNPVIDPATGEPEVYCSIYQKVFVRDTGKQSFENVSKELLYAYVWEDTDNDPTTDPVLVRVPLFADDTQDWYWQYDNNGLKLLQLRFYPVSTNVN